MTTSDSALSRLEEHLGTLLVTGVTLSAVVLAVGLGLYLAFPGNVLASRLLTIGLFVLMGTPMLRVVVSFAEYVRMRDWFFMTTTIIVLGVLATSVFVAFYGK
ncbi:MAG TPA: DUF1634 domain-containing protein [Vicinamibacterales bacterium]